MAWSKGRGDEKRRSNRNFHVSSRCRTEKKFYQSIGSDKGDGRQAIDWSHHSDRFCWSYPSVRKTGMFKGLGLAGLEARDYGRFCAAM